MMNTRPEESGGLLDEDMDREALNDGAFGVQGLHLHHAPRECRGAAFRRGLGGGAGHRADALV